MLTIGIIGAGHLGRFHIQQLLESDKFKVIGFADKDLERAKAIQSEFKIDYFADVDDLIRSVEVIDIVTPTLYHFFYAQKALRAGKHVFIEKPLTETLAEAEELLQLAKEANTKVQVGHVERFNPAFQAILPYINQPMFIEIHRLAIFNPRGTDVSVVLDLMIHDIDLILSIVKSPLKNVSASGVAVVSETPDIANARIEFHNGCVANLTASRISLKNMRKMRLFQKDAYISVDFLDKKTELVRLRTLEHNEQVTDPFAMILDLGENKTRKQIYFEKPVVTPHNAIKKELESFADAIQNDNLPKVSIDDGYQALKIAHQILDKIKLNNPI